MDKQRSRDPRVASTRLWQPDFVYVLALFLVAIAVLAFEINRVGLLSGGVDWTEALFFLAYSLYTITMGYGHPVIGHVSFDRVAQVACILVLGPVDAAR